MHGTSPKRTVIVASYRIYGEPIAPESGRSPTAAINGAGEIVEVHRRVGTVELIPEIPADLVSTSGASGMIRTSRDNQGCFRIDDCGGCYNQVDRAGLRWYEQKIERRFYSCVSLAGPGASNG